MKKVLVFGYIPKSKGGKQMTGLATGIYDLHNTVNSINSKYRIIIAATDIYEYKVKIDNTDVIGWNKKKLFTYAISRPYKLLFFIYQTLTLIKFRGIVSPLSLFVKFIFLDYAINLVKPDIVHFHGTYGALLSKGIRNTKIKTVLRIHGINGNDTNIPNTKIHFKLEKYITKLNFNIVSFVTNGIILEWNNLYGSFKCPMKPILNGYNHRLFKPSYSNDSLSYDLITFSGISPRKGQERIIEAIKNLKLKGLNYSYLIIGSGEDKYVKSLKEKVNKHQLDVLFIDYIPQEEIIKYLNKSKFFILPSTTEGFGKVFIESIGAGVPVIITSHIPLINEKGILTSKNSVIINDESIQSIENGLTAIYNNKLTFDKDEVSESIKKLQWENLALIYINSIYDCVNIS